MQEIQQVLDFAALVPIAGAVALFGYHLLNCWNRNVRSRQNPHTEAASVETEVDEPAISPNADLLPKVVETRDHDAEAHRLAELATKNPEFCREYEQILESGDDSLDWEPKWAALEMEPATAQIAVAVNEEGAIATLEKCPPFHAFSRLQEPVDPNKMNSQQLRQECQRLGVKWRNAHGKGRHMTRAEMLNEIGRAIA